MVVVGSVVGVLVAAVALILAIGAIGSTYVPERATASAIGSQPRPDTYKGWVSPKLFAPIAQSEADPRPADRQGRLRREDPQGGQDSR